MDTRQDDATVAATASKERGRVTRWLLGVAALGTVIAAVAGPGLAGEKAKWKLRTDSAYFTVFSYHCAPTFFTSVAKERPDGMEVSVLESRFRVDYDGDCRAFYLTEIAPRLDVAEYGVVAIIARD
jgi:hypothetical protein